MGIFPWFAVSFRRPPLVRSEAWLAFHIPADLADAFDDFVTAACAAIDCADRGDWADDERRIFEWMESHKWKANAEAHGRRSRTVQPRRWQSGW